MTKKYLLFFSIISYPLFYGQLFSNVDLENKKITEEFIEQNISKNNFNLLKKQRDSLNNPNLKSYNVAKAIASTVLYARYIRETEKQVDPKIDQYLREAIQIAKAKKYKNLEIYSTLAYGYYLYRFRELEKSLTQILNVKKDLLLIPEELVILPASSYKKLGFYFSTLGEYKESNIYLLKAEQFHNKKADDLGSIYDNIGVNYIQLKDYSQAKNYFRKALEVAKVNKDELRHAKVLGNQALLNYKLKDYPLAVSQLQDDIAISKKLNSDQNTMYAYTLLGRIYLDEKKFIEAEKALLLAHQYSTSNRNYKSNEFEILELLITIAKNKGDANAELSYRRKLEIVHDSINKTDGPEIIKKASWLAEKDKVHQSLIEERQKYETENIVKRVSIIIIGLLITLFLYWMYYQQKLRKIQNKKFQKRFENLLKEKIQSELQLQETNKSLEHYITYLKEKNGQLEQLEEELAKIKDSRSPKMEKRKLEIQELLKSHLMTDENWENFKEAYKVEYPDFYQYLLENFEHLTDSNLRLVMLISLKLNNNQISNLLGITVEGVKKAKQRLKKKLDDKYDYLFTELSNI